MLDGEFSHFPDQCPKPKNHPAFERSPHFPLNPPKGSIREPLPIKAVPETSLEFKATLRVLDCDFPLQQLFNSIKKGGLFLLKVLLRQAKEVSGQHVTSLPQHDGAVHDLCKEHSDTVNPLVLPAHLLGFRVALYSGLAEWNHILHFSNSRLGVDFPRDDAFGPSILCTGHI